MNRCRPGSPARKDSYLGVHRPNSSASLPQLHCTRPDHRRFPTRVKYWPILANVRSVFKDGRA